MAISCYLSSFYYKVREIEKIVIFAVVAGEKLEGVHASPSCTAQMVTNVQQVIRFMVSRRIKMHQTPAEGDNLWLQLATLKLC